MGPNLETGGLNNQQQQQQHLNQQQQQQQKQQQQQQQGMRGPGGMLGPSNDPRNSQQQGQLSQQENQQHGQTGTDPREYQKKTPNLHHNSFIPLSSQKPQQENITQLPPHNHHSKPKTR